MSTELTHFDEHGQAHMVDVSEKKANKRIATAVGTIYMSAQAFAYLDPQNNPKGDVLGVARIAAIQACKQTAQLIPLCHPLALTHIRVEFVQDTAQHTVTIAVAVETVGKTGVEMEALTGASVGLLTVYDMLKAVDKTMRINNVTLQSKYGGKSGDFIHPEANCPIVDHKID